MRVFQIAILGDLDMTDAAKTAVAVLAGWIGLVTDVSKKVPKGDGDNEYKKIGEIVIPVPSLEAFGITAKVKEIDEDTKLPIYEDDKMDWLFGAAVAQCKAQARNKLVPQTADLKDGQSIAANFEDLVKEGERKGNAEALKLAKEVAAAFTGWFQSLGKSVQAQAMATTLFKKTDALFVQPNDIKEKMRGYLTSFTESLEEADAVRYAKRLLAVEEACRASDATDF